MSDIFEGKALEDFVVHGELPQLLESRRGRIGASLVTPVSELFVRNILPAPSEDELRLDRRDAWSVEIEGLTKPQSITLGDLRKLPATEVTTVLQCSGNGRAFFDHEPRGVPWKVGAIANVTWQGVALSDLVDRAGDLRGTARFLTATGGEPASQADDVDRLVVERSIPVEKALRDCLLAWDLNGEPIPRAHGGPLRLIVPGYYGVNYVKYVRRLAFTREESGAALQATEYRSRPPGSMPGRHHPSMWEMNVKSFVTRTDLEEASLSVHGVAFGGESPIARVEVTVDGGTTWQDAKLIGEDLGHNAWRLWTLEMDAKEGSLNVASRASDRAGRIQPQHPAIDAAGYGHNGWQDHAVRLSNGRPA